MKFIEFSDTCVIERTTGMDEWDNPIRESIYEGECLYQEGGGYAYWYSPVFTRTPTLFLPGGHDELIHINDSVKVTTAAGREIESTVKVARDIALGRVSDKMLVTRLELKQAQGD